jgi:hypothetical protein
MPYWFFPTLVVGWVVITGLLAHVGGWASLARDFRSDEPPSGERFRFASGSVGNRFMPVNYGGCLFVSINELGFHLSLLLPFRFQSPPLFIPWRAVESVKEEQILFSKYAVVRIRGHWPQISLRGRAADRLQQLSANH